MKKISLILLCAVLVFTGCTQGTPVPEATQDASIPTPEQEQEAAVQSVATSKGTVTDSNEVTNDAGGYFVRIPSSWIGKTSYELFEDETYIYHITQDSSETSINPTILHVGAAYDAEPTNLYISAEVFLQMDDVKFYNVPVLDFPYVQGSADGNEYEGFIADIPMVLQSVWVIDESKWQQQINNQDDTQDINEPQGLGMPFEIEDATVNGIQLGAEKNTVLDSFKMYSVENVETYVPGPTSEEVEEYTFDFGTLRFTDGIFTGATIYSTVVGPRGFGIGDNIEDIIESFCSSVEYTGDYCIIYYRANEGDVGKTSLITPSCVLYDKDAIKKINFTCYDNPNILEEAGLKYLRANYMFEVQYVCSFCYDENGVVNEIMMYYGALAEEG